MYLQNKYTDLYNKIIARAQARSLTGYTERHHIIPKSLGGSNSKENLVRLTAKEHFICHRLLPKMLEGNERNKMVYALWQLANQRNVHQVSRHCITGKTYQLARIEFSKLHRERMINNHHFNDPAIREKHRLSVIKRGPTSKKGIKRSDSTKEKLRNRVWTEAAIANRLKNCLDSAAKRKGVKNPEHGTKLFSIYVVKNKLIILLIWEKFDLGLTRRQISIELGVSWDRVNVAINRRTDIQIVLEKLNENQ